MMNLENMASKQVLLIAGRASETDTNYFAFSFNRTRLLTHPPPYRDTRWRVERRKACILVVPEPQNFS